MQQKVSYWVIFNVNDAKNVVVRAVMNDGTTKSWRPGDKGFGSAKRRANAYLNRKRR